MSLDEAKRLEKRFCEHEAKTINAGCQLIRDDFEQENTKLLRELFGRPSDDRNRR